MKRLLAIIILGLASLASAQNSMFFQSAYSTATVSNPTFSPASPYSGVATTVTISPGAIPASGQTIYYCVSTTTCTPSTVYTTGISFTSTENIFAFATATGYNQSATVEWQGTITLAMGVIQTVNLPLDSSGTTSSFTATLTATPANASVLVGCIASATIASFTPASPTQVLTNAVGNFDGFWIYNNITTGTTSITVHTAGMYSAGACIVAVVSNIVTSSPVDQTSHSGALYSTSPPNIAPSTGSVTTTNAQDVIVAMGDYITPPTITAGSGYTSISVYCDTSNYCVALEYLNVSSTGTYNPTFNLASSGTLYAGTVGFIL